MFSTINKKNLLLNSYKCLQKCARSCKTAPKKPFNMIKYLQAKMKFSGPITVYEYMNEALTNPLGGYYITKDAFSTKKDFITSPDVSQMFGELIGIWIYYEWQKLGSPKPLQLVELGPGNGTMMSDALRIFRKFANVEDVEIHLIEKSLKLSIIQEETICGSVVESSEDSYDGDKLQYRVRKTSDGMPIYWSSHLSLIPKKFSIIFANEFFDALPMHKLINTENGWREILVDIDENNDDSFRYVISPTSTHLTSLFDEKEKNRKFIEISPEAGHIVTDISNRLYSHGGIALLIDYGSDGGDGDTFRAFENHKQVDPLVNPGTRDLTYDIDFSLIRNLCKDKSLCFGPVTQNFFLQNIGIGYRLQQVLKTCKNEEMKEIIISNYNMLMDSDKMGERFKVMSLYPNILAEYLEKSPPIGFHKIVEDN